MRSYLLSLLLICVLVVRAQDSASVLKPKEMKEVVVKASATRQIGNLTKISITRDMRRGKNSVGEMLGGLPNMYFACWYCLGFTQA